MTAETLTGARAAAAIQPAANFMSGVPNVAWGHYSIAATALEDGDIFKLCKLPKNALVIGGWYTCGDLDTGTEAVDIDMGWADNGGASETYTGSDGTTYTNMYDGNAAAAGFVNSGVLTGDAITDLLAAGNNLRFFPMTNGPIYFSRETIVQFEANVAQNTPQAGVVMVVILYIALG